MPLIIIVRNKCKKNHCSSKRNFCSQRKEGSSSIWQSYFHYFIFMFHLPSCSKLQLPIGLPAQSVSALWPRQVSIFLAFLIHRALKTQLPPPWYICKMSTVSARSRRSYRKIEDYEVYRDTASCGSLSWPWCLTSTQFPLPLPTPHPGPCVIELSIPGEDLWRRP